MCKQETFSLDQFIALLAEIEVIFNSRPLTYVYKDIESGLRLILLISW